MIKLQTLILEAQSDNIYDSVKQYQNGFTVGDVQRYLRKRPLSYIPKGYTSSEYKQFLQVQVDNLDSAIASSKTYPVGTIFWRGVDSKSIYTKSTTDLGYTSIALNNNDTVQTFGSGGMIMKLIIEKPVKGLDMNKYLKSSDIDGESQEEILLERGLTFVLEQEGEKFNTYKIIK
jgi:hypothetical protein